MSTTRLKCAAPGPAIIRLAAPRGFCAGVERAIRTVEDALATFGPPVYVRHEIVHNAHVVRRLEAMGAVFVEHIGDLPVDRPLIISAHGAPQSAHDEASARKIALINATCPLVLKVHNDVRRHIALGRYVILIGHEGHAEVAGTMGQCAKGDIALVESALDAELIAPPDRPLAYATQTTLSIDDATRIIAVLKRRFPQIVGPRKSDICYATQNRQDAAKRIADGADIVLVVGSPQSSNSKRLVEAAIAGGAGAAHLVDDPNSYDLAATDSARIIGVTSGASTPESLVEGLIKIIAERRPIKVETIETAREDVTFKQPMLLAS